MDIGVIAKRYAKALLLFAQEQKAEDTVYQEVLQFIDSYGKVEQLPGSINRGEPSLPEICNFGCRSSSRVVHALHRL